MIAPDVEAIAARRVYIAHQSEIFARAYRQSRHAAAQRDYRGQVKLLRICLAAAKSIALVSGVNVTGDDCAAPSADAAAARSLVAGVNASRRRNS